MRNYIKIFEFLSTCAVWLGSSHNAVAQVSITGKLPDIRLQDPNGVDLKTGQIIRQNGRIGIGLKDSPDLTFDIAPTWADTGSSTPRYQPTIYQTNCPGPSYQTNALNDCYVEYHALIGTRDINFGWKAAYWGMYPAISNSGAKLDRDDTGFIVTEKDGTQWHFSAPYVPPMSTGRSTIGTLQYMSRPDGTRLQYYANGVVTNTGYLLHFDDLGRNQATLINLAVDYCNPDAPACSNLTRIWPHISYTKDGSGYSTSGSYKDTLGRATKVTQSLIDSTHTSTTITSPSGIQYTYYRTIYNNISDGGSAAVIDRYIDATGATNYSYTYGHLAHIITAKSTRPSGGVLNYTLNLSVPYRGGDREPFPYTQTITDEIGRATTVTFSSSQSMTSYWPEETDLSQVVYPEGGVVTLSRNSHRQLTTVKNTPKANSGLTSVLSTANYTDCANWISCSGPDNTIDPLKNQTDYTYDAVTGLVLTKIEPADTNGYRAHTFYQYEQLQAKYKNATGQLAVSGNPIWKLVSTSTCRTQPSCLGTNDELITTYQYDSNLLPTIVTVHAGDGSFSTSTTTSYDAVGNIITVDGPLTGADDTTWYAYDDARQVKGSIGPDPDGSGALNRPAARYSYDFDGRVTLVETGTATEQTETGLSAMSVQKSISSTYDGIGRKTKEVVKGWDGTRFVVSSVTQYSYDLDSHLLCTAVRMDPDQWENQTDACVPQKTSSNGPDRVTKNVYDAAGQLIQVRKAVGTPLEQAYTTYTYTADGKQEYVIDANGNRAQFVYDGYDRLAKWYFPSSSLPSSFNGSSQATALSSAGSINSGDYEEYGYDPNGNRTSLRKRDGRTFAYTYDALNRVIKKQVPKACVSGYVCTTPPADTVRDVYYGYDLQGHQLYARFDSDTGEGITNEFDGLGRQISTKNDMDGTARKLSFQYDAAGNRTQVTFLDTQCFNYTYDALNRLRDIYQSGVYQSGICQTGSGAKAVSLEWNAQGQLWHHNRGAVTTTYGYDGISRLESLSDALPNAGQSVTLRFTYNPASQIIQRDRSNDAYRFNGYANADRAYTPNGLNQYAQVGTNPNKYDSNGNLIEDGDFNTGANRYGYDAENRLVTSELKSSSTIALRYDPLGRLFKISGGNAGTTQFLYDGDQLVAEYAGNGALLRRYVHGPGEDDPLLWYEGAGLGDRRSLQIDQQGSIVSVASASGTASIYSYDDYGNPNSGQTGRFQYTGQAWIPELGLYYYKARMYAPKIGRFLQTDPIGYKDQINLYAYVANDPVDGRDPSGAQAVNCSFSEKTGQGACTTTDDGKKDLTLTTSLTDKSGHTSSVTKVYSAGSVAMVGRVASFVNAQYRYDMGANVGIKGPSISSEISSAFGQIMAAIGFGRNSGPSFQTESEARQAAARNGWQETNQMSPGGRGKFYRDENGNLWTRDRDGHNGGAWKQYDRSGTQRLGTYDENLNKIGK